LIGHRASSPPQAVVCRQDLATRYNRGSERYNAPGTLDDAIRMFEMRGAE